MHYIGNNLYRDLKTLKVWRKVATHYTKSGIEEEWELVG